MNTPVKIISHLRGLGIKLKADGDRLRFEGPKGALTQELRSMLRERKPELLDFLKRVGRPKHRAISPRENPSAPPALSYAQQRLWFLHQMNPRTDAYNVFSAIRLEGNIRILSVIWCLNEIVIRHETLRTTFRLVESIPVQWITPPERICLSVPLFDLSRLTGPGEEKHVLDLSNRMGAQPFDLELGPLFRARLIRLTQQAHILAINIHHIVTDGWSRGILACEFFTLYAAHTRGLASPLPALPIQYADFSVWQRQWLTSEVVAHQSMFWQRQLADAPGFIKLPTDRRHPPVKTYAGNIAAVRISGQISNRLEALIQDQEITSFMLLQAVFLVLLHRYSGQDDILIGSPVANRNRKEIESLIGFFVNTLAFRHNLFGDPGFLSFLKRVRQNVIEAYSHQDIPFEQVVEMVKPERNTAVSPLFQVLFTMQSHFQAPRRGHTDGPRLRLPEITISFLPTERIAAKFDLTLSLLQTTHGFQGGLEYNTDVFEADTIQRMIGHLQTLMEHIVAQPELPISRLPMLTQSERRQLMDDWNDDASVLPPFGGLLEPFTACAETRPDAIALIWRKRQVTYAGLRDNAAHFAALLQESGTGAVVAVLSTTPPDILAAWLAVLTTGNIIMTLNPRHPSKKLLAMLAHSQVKTVLADHRARTKLKSFAGAIVDLDGGEAKQMTESSLPDPRPLERDDAVFVFYQASLTNLTAATWTAETVSNLGHWFANMASNNGAGHVLNTWPLASAASVKTIFSTLWNGATLVLHDLPREDTLSLMRLIQDQPVHVLCGNAIGLLPQFTLSTRDRFRVCDLGVLFVSGGGVPLGLISRWARGQGRVKLFHLYSNPTRGDVVFCHEFSDEDGRIASLPPMGKPINRVLAHVVDRNRRLVPAGVAGELVIGGGNPANDGQAVRSEQLQARLIACPFDSARRFYRSGDLVKRLPDGNLFYLGRIRDRLLYDRGIDAGEIERVLCQHENLAFAMVHCQTDVPEPTVTAYVMPGFSTKSRPKPNPKTLHHYLKQQFPSPWLPNTIIILDALPLTPDGDLDSNALPQPKTTSPEDVHSGPRTPIQQALTGIWADVLRSLSPSIDDHFFDLGGTSLLATQVVSRIREKLRVDLSLVDLFRAPTIAGLSEIIARARALSSAPGTPCPLSRDQPPELSFAQQRLWFLDQLERDSPVFNIFVGLRLHGWIDIAVLEQAFLEIGHRHETTRTRFVTLDQQDRPVQIIQPTPMLSVTISDLRHLKEATQKIAAETIAQRESKRPFDLSRGPLLRLYLLRLATTENMLLITMHHIISDGWSMGVLIHEWVMLYRGLTENRRLQLPSLPIQYADFAVWQRHWLSGATLENQRAFWAEQLAGAPALLHLPTDHPRPPHLSFRGAAHPIRLDAETNTALRAWTKGVGASLFMGLHTAFSILLARYCGQEDICIGSPVANRHHKGTENLIGFFVNTLVLRTVLKGNPSCNELLEDVRQNVLLCFGHQDIPFERVVEALQPDRNLAYTPLFQVMFVFQNTPPIEETLPGLTMSPLHLKTEVSVEFDLVLTLTERGATISGLLQYNTDLFEPATVRRLSRHFENLIKTIVVEPGQRVFDFSLMDERERHQLLFTWNHNPSRALKVKPITLIIEERARQKPEAAAISLGNQTLLRGELNGASEALARRLMEHGVGPGILVALHAKRSIETVIAILAILRTGGAFLPLDPSLPRKRTALILEDARVPLLLSDGEATAGFRGITMQPRGSTIGKQPPSTPAGLWPEPSGKDLAYVIYTSGSTGKPKGVCIDHGSLDRHCQDAAVHFRLQERDFVLQFASFSFDASLEQLFCPLITGSRLLVRGDGIWTLEESARLMRDLPISVVDLPTSYALQLLRIWSSVDLRPNRAFRLLVVGGEALPRWVALAWQELGLDGVEFRNAYGPTETTITATVHSLQKNQTITIGRPLPGRFIYVLDRFLRPLPIGVAGELYIGGTNLARGYLNQPCLSAEHFLPNPFYPGDPDVATVENRLYRTGDLVRYQENGNLCFLGRVDHQVKLRGFRVELGEIEALLSRHTRIRQAVVMLREDRPGERELTAYILEEQGNPEGQKRSPDYKAFLKTSLPGYMLPRFLIIMDRFPLTPSGKLDRSVLPKPGREDSHALTVPHNPIEEILSAVWCELLDLKRVGIHDSFFDLGGHSLMATRVLSRCREAFAVELSLQSFFEKPTITALAKQIEAKRSSGSHATKPAITPVPRTGAMPLSLLQERMWYSMANIENQHGAYNMPLALRLLGLLHPWALERSLTRIVGRHEMLRTSFALVDGAPVQTIGPPRAANPPLIDLESLGTKNRHKTIKQLLEQESGRAFDLIAGPLFTVGLIRLTRTAHLLLVNMNHIIADGWSIAVLVGEFSTFYKAYARGRDKAEKNRIIPPLKLQYADFAYWQRYAAAPHFQSNLGYWVKRLAGAPPRLTIRGGHWDPDRTSLRGASQGFWIGAELTHSLRVLGSSAGATLFMALQTGYALLLAYYSGQDDVTIGATVSNRKHLELEPLIGLFFNLLPLRIRLPDKTSATLLDFIRQIRLDTLEAFDHQDFSFEGLLDALQIRRTASHYPLFQATFALQNAPSSDIRLPGLTLERIDIPTRWAKYDITLFVSEMGDRLMVSFSYREQISTSSTIHEMLSHFRFILETMARHPEQTLAFLFDILARTPSPVTDSAAGKATER